MWISNIFLLLNIVNVNTIPLYNQYYSLSLDNSKFIIPLILNDTYNEIYNNITKSINNNKTFYIFKSPFCDEPENLYNKIKHNIYDNILYRSIININHNKNICPNDYNYGYVLWSYNQLKNNIHVQNYIHVFKIKKYVKYVLKKINNTFPNSNIISIYNISSSNKYTIFATNCCPYYNISL